MRNNRIFFDRTKNQFVGLTEDMMIELKKKHTQQDIDTQLDKMAAWLIKHKRTVGTLEFIKNWLNRSYKPEVAVALPQPTKKQKQDTIYELYLRELWMNSEKLLSFNTLTE